MSSKKRSSAAAVAIIEGNDDLLTEILLFLPTQSLVRFKVVSKRWRSLISAPSFCRRHRPETQPLFILRGYAIKHRLCIPSVRKLFPFSFPSRLFKSKPKILQSCNGLLLLSCRGGSNRNSYSYYVFNPTTMQRRRLSRLPNTSVRGIYLMFDPSLSPHYRVVYFAYTDKKRTTTLIYFYDSVTRKWKLGGETLRYGSSWRDGIYFNGGIYFVKSRGRVIFSLRFDPPDDHVIVRRIPSPPEAHICRIHETRLYAESNGVLLSLVPTCDNGGCVLNVWEMKANENGWSNKYRVNIRSILKRCGGDGPHENYRLLGVITGEKEEDSMLVFHNNGRKMVIYRFYDRRILKSTLDCTDLQFRSFIRSLAPV